MQVEFFSAECPLCNGTIDMLEKEFPELSITVHRAND